jgi:coA-disulfide reductase
MTVQELANMDFLYAPPFSTTWDIINVAANVAK